MFIIKRTSKILQILVCAHKMRILKMKQILSHIGGIPQWKFSYLGGVFNNLLSVLCPHDIMTQPFGPTTNLYRVFFAACVCSKIILDNGLPFWNYDLLCDSICNAIRIWYRAEGDDKMNFPSYHFWCKKCSPSIGIITNRST